MTAGNNSSLFSAARLQGFEDDLRLTDAEYDTTLSILYVHLNTPRDGWLTRALKLCRIYYLAG